jgi:predicted adenylyl cyclase CyaB
MQELEIKCLLNESNVMDKQKLSFLMSFLNTNYSRVGESSQLNHYFAKLENNIDAQSLFTELNKLGFPIPDDLSVDFTKASVRTRQTDTETILVIKEGKDPLNGGDRREIEFMVAGLPIHVLDECLISVGFSLDTKWSRSRITYTSDGVTVCVDKNAGYGYIIEIEKMFKDDSDTTQALDELKTTAKVLGLYLLPKERLSKMYEFYRKNWQDFYLTDNYFCIM